MNVIETHGLVRFFQATPAVRGLDLSVPEGAVLGLLGENASGKTTTLNLIMGRLLPNDGTVRVFGADPVSMKPALRSRIAYVADEMALPKWMKLREAMRLHASYFPQWDAAQARELMARFELQEKRPFGALSKGQKRRFFLVLAVAQQPDLLVLDEPAGGLDVAVRRQFLDLILDVVNERRVTVVLSSHILSDVERVVDHVAFIKAGRLVRQSGLEDLKASVKRLCFPSEADIFRLCERFRVLAVTKEHGMQTLVVEDFAEGKLDATPCQIEHLNLEELFLVYNGGKPDEKDGNTHPLGNLVRAMTGERA